MTFQVYKDRKKEWRWRLHATNGKIIADSGEGYKRKAACYRGIKLIQLESPTAHITQLPIKRKA